MKQKSSELSKKACVPCREGTKALTGSTIDLLKNKLSGNWQIVSNHHLQKEFHFKDFSQAMLFINQVAAIAERERHHPDIQISYNKVKLIIWTHKVDGLTESDFILAAKINDIPVL